MGLGRILGKSKAKAALALSNPANAILPADAETRISALESGTHTHANKTQLDKIKGFGSWNFFGDGTGVSLVTKTGDYTLTTTDSMILGDATTVNINFTLPNPSSCYDGANLASIVYNVSKIDISANTVTILPYATETIGGNVSLVLAAQNEAIELVTDGTNWYIKG